MKVRILNQKYNFVKAKSVFSASGLLFVPESCCCRACISNTGGGTK